MLSRHTGFTGKLVLLGKTIAVLIKYYLVGIMLCLIRYHVYQIVELHKRVGCYGRVLCLSNMYFVYKTFIVFLLQRIFHTFHNFEKSHQPTIFIGKSLFS